MLLLMLLVALSGPSQMVLAARQDSTQHACHHNRHCHDDDDDGHDDDDDDDSGATRTPIPSKTPPRTPDPSKTPDPSVTPDPSKTPPSDDDDDDTPPVTQEPPVDPAALNRVHEHENGDIDVITYNPRQDSSQIIIDLALCDVLIAAAQTGPDNPHILLGSGQDYKGRAVSAYFVYPDQIQVNGFYDDGKPHVFLVGVGVNAANVGDTIPECGWPPATPQIDVFDPALSKIGYLPQGSIGLPGEALAWEVTVSNYGTLAGTNVVVQDELRPELRVDDVRVDTTLGITYTITGQLVTVTIPKLDPGQQTVFYIDTTVLTSPLDGTIDNTVTLDGTAVSDTATIVLPTLPMVVMPLSMPPPPNGPDPNIAGLPHEEVFAGEMVCFDAQFTNAGTNPGYGPYLRLVVPPEITINSMQFIGSGQTWHEIGTFSSANGFTLADPIGQDDITGPDGYRLYVVRYPIGSVVTGNPSLDMNICMTIASGALINEPYPFEIVPGYEFGDTPTGVNGPITDPVDPGKDGSITPVLVLFDKEDNTPESERPPGPAWTYQYTLDIELAPHQRLVDAVFTDTLDSDWKFVSVDNVTGTCTMVPVGGNVTPPVDGGPNVGGGNLLVEFDEIINPGSSTCTVEVVYSGYILDILTEDGVIDPDEELILNTATFDSTWTGNNDDDSFPQPQLEDTNEVHVENMNFQKNASPTSVEPGSVVDYTIDFQITEYDSVSSAVITDTVPNGMSPDYNSFTVTLGGATYPIPDGAIMRTTGADGRITVVFDLIDATGIPVPLPQAGSGQIRYQSAVDDFFRDASGNADLANPVRAADVLSNSVTGDFTLSSGAVQHNDSNAVVEVIPVEIQKQTMVSENSPENGVGYTHGEDVTFRLTMEIPSGDTRGVVFKDYFPLPVFDIDDPDLGLEISVPMPYTLYDGTAHPIQNQSNICYQRYNLGENTHNCGISVGPDNTLDEVIIQSVNINGVENSLEIVFGDVNTNSPQTLQLDITVAVIDNPFANGLYLSNQFEAEVRNTAGESITADAISYLNLSAPDLTIVKGVVEISDAGTIDPPAPGGIGADSDSNATGLDVGDLVTYTITVTNIGGAAANNVLITDTLPAALESCSMISVLDGNGISVAYTGTDLFGAGIQLTAPIDGDPAGPGPDNQVVVRMQCEIADGASPAEVITNLATVEYYNPLPEDGYTYDTPPVPYPPRSDDATVTIREVEVDKSVNPTTATIGEIVQYTLEVTIPESTLPNAQIVDTLPAGMAYVGCISAASDNNNLTTTLPGGFGDICNDPTNPTVANNGHVVTYNLGDLAPNASSINGQDMTVTIVYDAVVLDVAANVRDATPENTATFSADGMDDVEDSTTLTIIEPTFQVIKTASPDTGDAGDTITFDITISHTAASNATAYDIVLEDDIPAEFTSLSVTHLSGVAPDNGPTLTGNTLTADWDSLSLGQTSTIRVTGVLVSGVIPNQQIVNTAEIEYTSLPGDVTDQSPYTDPTDRERTYTDDDPETVTIYNVTPEKAIINTTESHTDDSSLPNDGSSPVPVTIGEIVTFELRITIPEGQSDNVVVTDVLPDGLLLMPGTGHIYTESASAMNFTTLGMTPPTVAPGDPIAIGGDGARNLSFSLGNITNNDSDPDDEQVVLTFDALVVNIADSTIGTEWTNTFSVSVDGATPVESNEVDVLIQEPVVTIDKQVNTGPFANGDTVTYDLVITAGNAVNNITAYDLNVEDTLPTELDFVSATIHDQPAYAGTVLNSTSPVLDADIVELRPGDSVTLRITMTVPNTVTYGQVINNEATVTWTSTPGEQGTGDGIPGDSGDPDGERNGSGGVNTYTDTDDVDIDISGPLDTVKSIVDTSEAHTDDSSLPNDGSSNVPVTIGEIITYRLEVMMPEMTSPDVVIVDTLPANLQYMGGTARISYSADNTMSIASVPGIANETTPTTTVPSGLVTTSGTSLTFSLGPVVNDDSDDEASTERIIIEFDALVLNSTDNNLATVFNNVFTVDLDGDGTPEDTSNNVPAVVQEPVLTATKSIVGTAPNDALDNVIYDIVITAGSATNNIDAYNVRVYDLLDIDLELVSAVVQTNPGYVTVDVDDSNDTAYPHEVDLLLNRLEAGDSVTIRVEAEVRTTVAPGKRIENSARTTWTSTPGDQGTGDGIPGDSGDPDGERNGDDGPGGSLNDYAVDTNVPFFDIDAPEPIKSIVTTSVVDTDDNPSLDGSTGNERPATIGEVVTYRLVTILPESTSTTFEIVDNLPVGLLYVAGSARVSYTADTTPGFDADFAGIQNETTPSFTFPAARAVYNPGANTVTFNFGQVVNNDGDSDAETIIIEFDAIVDDVVTNQNGDPGTLLINDFDVVVDRGLPTEVITPSNEVVVEVVEPEVAISKTFTPNEQIRGGTVTMTLVITNLATNGANAVAYDLNVTDTLDDWLHVTSAPVITLNTEAIAYGTSTIDNSVVTPGFATGVSDVIDVVIDALPVDGSVTIEVSLQIDPDATPGSIPRTITNTASVTADTLPDDDGPTDGPDRDYTENDSDDLDVVKPDLRVTKTDSPDPVVAGETLIYTIDIRNTGTPNFDATDVIFMDELPAEFTVTLVTPSQGTCSPLVGTTLTCTLGTIASGANASVTIQGTVAATTAHNTIIDNTAYVTSEEGNDGDDPSKTPDDDDDERAEEPTTVIRNLDVEITKTVNQPQPREGDLITYTLLVENHGASDATNVVVTDSIPAGLTFVSFAPVTHPCSYIASTLTCTFPALAAGDQILIGIEATVDIGTGGTSITNTGSVTVDETETDTTNNDDDAVIEVQTVDLEIIKTVNPAAPTEGATIVYTLTARNNGPADATGVTVTDDIASVVGVTYASDDSGGAYDPITGIWTIGNLPAGQSRVLQITASVDAGAAALAQPITNNATIDGDQTDRDPTNNDDDADITVGGLDLAIEKTVNNPLPNEGDTITYSITVRNLGAANGTNIQATDDLAGVAGITYISDNGAGVSYNPATGIWQVGNLNAGQSRTLVITATVDANASTLPQPIVNVARITGVDQDDNNPDNDEDDAEIEVRPLDLGVTKTVDNSTPSAGDMITYTIVLTNYGPANGTGIVVTDALDGQLNFVSANPSPAYNAATGQWTVGNLNAGQSRTLTITAQVDASVASGTVIPNVATITNVDQTDTDPTNNTDDEPVYVDGLDIAVYKVVDNPTPSVGDSITYTITVVNNGPMDGTGIEVLDVLPAELNGLSYTESQGTFSTASNIWDVGDLVVGASATLDITAEVLPAAAGNTIDNTASLYDVDQEDSDPTNNDETATIVVGVVDLAVTKVVSNPSPSTGDTITYTIEVVNNGPSNATGVTVTENLPTDGVSFTLVSNTPSKGTFNHVAGSSVWTVGDLAVGESATLQLEVIVHLTGGVFTNHVEVDSNEPDSDPTNNEDDEDIALDGTDLAVTKSVSEDQPFTGDTIIYTIVARNLGPNDATGVTVHDTLPAGVVYVADGSGGAYNPVTGIWTIGNLASGASATLNITVDVTAASGTIVNRAIVDGDQPDPDPSNNEDDEPIIVSGADLRLSKTRTVSSARVGDTVVYVLTVTNDGPNPTTGVEVQDRMPVTLTYVSATPSKGTVSAPPSSPVVWTVGDLAIGESATLVIYSRINGRPGSTTNIAEVTNSDLPDPDSTPGNNVPGEDDQDTSTGPNIPPPDDPDNGGTPPPATPEEPSAPDLTGTGGAYPTPAPLWDPLPVCSYTCQDFQVYHTNRTGNWEIFRLGDAPGRPGANPNLSQGDGEGVDDIAPTISPNGEWIAFTSNRDGNWEIYLGRTDGTEQRRVTYNTVAIDTQPVWGPNNFIVYESSRDGNWNLFLLDVVTGNEERLTTNTANDMNAFWSPDGSRILFQSDRSGTWQIYELDLRTRAVTLISDGLGVDVDPMYAPDGERVLFRSYREGHQDKSVLYVLDGESLTAISHLAGNATNAAWSPDADLIAYQSDLNGDLDVYVHDLSSGATRALTDNDVDDYAPVWLCGSTQVIFTSENDGTPNLYQADALDINAPAVDLDDTAQAQQLTDTEFDDVYPVSAPGEQKATREGHLPGGNLGMQTSFLPVDFSTTPIDSSSELADVWEPVAGCNAAICTANILYHSDQTGDWEIFSTDGSSNINVSRGGGAVDMAPTRSPDGRWVAFASDRDGNWEIYVVATDGTGLQRITASAGADMHPVWSADSSTLAYISDRNGNNDLYTFNIFTGIEQQVTFGASDDRNPYWHPAGARIIFQRSVGNQWQIYALNRRDGQLQLLSGGAGSHTAPVVSFDGAHIAYLSEPGDGSRVLYVMNQDGANPRQISATGGRAGSASWYTDDSMIAYEMTIDGKTAVYVYEFATGQTRQLTAADSNVQSFAPTWMCDHPDVVFTAQVEGNTSIYRLPALPLDGESLSVPADAERLTFSTATDAYPQNASSEENTDRTAFLPQQ